MGFHINIYKTFIWALFLGDITTDNGYIFICVNYHVLKQTFSTLAEVYFSGGN